MWCSGNCWVSNYLICVERSFLRDSASCCCCCVPYSCCCCSGWLPKQRQSFTSRRLLLNLSEGNRKCIFVSKSFSNFLWIGNKSFYAISVWHFIVLAPLALYLRNTPCQKVITCKHSWKPLHLGRDLDPVLDTCVEELRFCGAASRVDEWIITLAYQVTSDQNANLFNFMLTAWVSPRQIAWIVHPISRFLKQELHMWRKTIPENQYGNWAWNDVYITKA